MVYAKKIIALLEARWAIAYNVLLIVSNGIITPVASFGKPQSIVSTGNLTIVSAINGQIKQLQPILPFKPQNQAHRILH